ncbi:MAG: hypothetical protein GKR89_03980 [Candidatus Latescibacteria bacterium]|nr:hypothetical protein [Candidatus Latescibacterota bacterium]
MKRYTFYFILSAIGVGALAGKSQAHSGDIVYPAWELPTSALPDLHDGSLADWEDWVPGPSFSLNDMGPAGPFEDGARGFDPDELFVDIYVGWNSTTQRLYIGAAFTDDHLSAAAGALRDSVWLFDGIEVMIDGDHSGGIYAYPPEQTPIIPRHSGPLFSHGESGLTAAEERDFNYGQAQHYFASPQTGTGPSVGLGFEPAASWITRPPYADIGGSIQGGSPNRAVIEFMITPFDHFNRMDPTVSRPSRLAAHGIIGIQFGVPDFDDQPGHLRDYFSLSGQAQIRRDASVFVDFQLYPCQQCTATVSQPTSWSWIKARFLGIP